MLERKTARNVRQMFFEEFSFYHCKWLRELVAKYKERGVFPILPTQIMEYYQEPLDKDIAVLSALCMCWDNGKELEQIASMRKLIGKNPAQWWKDREFVTISVGREQNRKLEGHNNGQYWKIAKMYDILYDLCKDGLVIRRPSDVFRKLSSFDSFCKKVSDVCMIPDMDYKRDVISLVMRTDDGMGRGLWYGNRVRCPMSAELKRYMTVWFPYWRTKMWTWDEAVSLFRLEKNYDFFYAYLAHQELGRENPQACSQYLTRYKSRWETKMVFPKKDWVGDRGRMPKIEFNDLND